MPKPIVIIYFPDQFVAGGSGRRWIYEYMRYLNGEEPNESAKVHWPQSDYWKDYYWFCFYKNDIQEPEFKIFHEKDFTEIQYNELKELINQSLKETAHA